VINTVANILRLIANILHSVANILISTLPPVLNGGTK
jgi:hypothetical protein